MAKNEKNRSIFSNLGFRRKEKDINSSIDQASLSLYGTDTRDIRIDELRSKFQDIVNNDKSSIDYMTGGYTTFINELMGNNNKFNKYSTSSLMNISSNNLDSYSMQAMFYNAYQNKLLEQHDIQEITSQLVELQSAIEITTDAIISANVNTGRMNRVLNVENIAEDDTNSVKRLIENIEKQYDLQNRIKNFIVPNTLITGEYYVYAIAYSELFDQISKQKEKGFNGIRTEGVTVLENFDDASKSKRASDKELSVFLEDVYSKYCDNLLRESGGHDIHKVSMEISKTDFKNDMKNILGNISISTDEIPLPLITEGLSSYEFIAKYMNEKEHENIFMELANTGTIDSDKVKKKNMFKDINGTYISMIDSTKIIPINIMDTTIGYIHVVDENITPLSGPVSTNLYQTRYSSHASQSTIIDEIADRVVKSFDKPFLKKNIKFKEAIVNCFKYYNLNEKKLHFQYISAEHIVPFKINKDVNGRGTSMLKKSLFWGKLYLMLTLFNIMSVILYSNDQKVSYVKQSGIEKNIANNVQNTMRNYQNRQINITDLFSYTTLINKVGSGNQMVVPVGSSGERPIETEILSGQDIQMHNDLVDLCKNNTILGTGVPAAIMNYMNEADYAKTIDEQHSKFNAKVINFQLDFNEPITELYKIIIRNDTKIDESIIDSFSFIFQPPRSNAGNLTNEFIDQQTRLMDFIVANEFEDPNTSENAEEITGKIREFKKLFCRANIQMIDYGRIDEMIEQATIEYEKSTLKPDKSNGDSGDDDGIDEELMM